MKKFLVIALLLKLNLAVAQVESRFVPLTILDTIPTSLHQSFKTRLHRDIESVAVRGKVGSYMKTLYEQRHDYLVKTFNEDYFMLGDDLTNYLQGILLNVYNANPGLPRETSVYAFRSATPNAVSFGEGTLAIMLGLLARMETEDVLAYVLCHEIAHYHANHSRKRMEELANLNYDRVLKKQIADIRNSQYGSYSKLKALFNSLDLSVSKHSREAELEADSLGLIYFLKTKYNRLAPLHCMTILGGADSSMFKGRLDLKKYFHFDEFPFKESWDTYAPSELWQALPPYSYADTARTHPNCDTRFDALKRQLQIPSPTAEAISSGTPIASIQTRAAFETLNSLYHFKQFGKAMFEALILAEKFPQHPYPHAILGKCLYQIHKHQREHKLSEVLELPDPRFDENYNRFLAFIHKLRLYELANVAYQYVATRPESFYSDEEFLHALWMCSRLQVSKLDPDKVRIDYENLFPNGRYAKEMKAFK